MAESNNTFNGPGPSNITGQCRDIINHVNVFGGGQPSDSRSIFFNVKSPEDNFVGRSEILKYLKDFFESTSTKSKIIVISGLGGIGKTQLVRKCIQENRRSFKNVIWINSEKIGSIDNSFKNLASVELGITLRNTEGDAKELNSIIEQVVNKLSNSKTLFVYDNVEKIESISFLLTIEPSGSKPHVVITSRIQEWGDGIDVKQLMSWELREAMSYVLKMVKMKSSDDVDESNIQLLVETLQYFPLALRQATAYINYQRKVERNFGITNYLAKYNAKKNAKENAKEMLGSEIFKKDPVNIYAETTLTTWSTTIDAIKQDAASGTLACRILNIIAYFYADNIHREIFIHLTDPSDNRDLVKTYFEKDIRSAVRLLINYSMIDGYQSQSVLSIHRLVQLVIKLNLSDTKEDKPTLIDALILILKLIDVESSILKDSHSHLVSVFISALDFEDLVKDDDINCLPSKILNILLRNLKDYQAIAFGNEILEPLEQILGKHHEVILTTRHLLAYSYAQVGKHNDAIQELEKVLEIRNEKLHIDPDILKVILTTRHLLAYSYAHVGKHSEAKEMFAEVLEQRKIILGDNHPETLSTKHNLAYACIKLGDYSAAVQMYEEKLEKCKNELGEDHPDTLTNRHDLAYSYMKVGRYEDAIQMFNDVLGKRTELLGEDHPHTLGTKHQLAYSYTQIGKHTDGIQMFKDVLKRRKKILGDDHADTLTVGHNLAYSYGQIEKHSDAIQMFEDVLEKRTKLLGEDHTHTLGTKHQLAYSYSQIGNHTDAIPMFKEVLEKRKKILGDDHADTLTVGHNLAYSYGQIGKHSLAIQIFEDVLKRRKKILGDDHADTCITRDYLTQVQRKGGIACCHFIRFMR